MEDSEISGLVLLDGIHFALCLSRNICRVKRGPMLQLERGSG